MSNLGTIVEAKRRCRRECRRRLTAVTEVGRQRDSEAIRRRLCQLSEWQDAQTVLLFYSLPPEPDVLPLWRIATETGKTVGFPSFVPATQSYVARQVDPWPPDRPLPEGAFGIPEPAPTAPLLDRNRLDFVVVPGLGFAPDGRRLGRGRGFYDRLLADLKGFRCGVAYDEQIVAELPTEPHDIRCDCILTPSHGWLCSRART